MTHELKVWTAYFNDIVKGVKSFEVRRNDRNFLVGDELYLREWNESEQSYTGRGCRRIVTYILQGGKFGLEPGYVVMAIKPELSYNKTKDHV